MVFALILKMISDACTCYFFIQAFSFFIEKKRQTKSKEALGLSPLNKFIIVSICIMFVMRVLGTLFNTLVGISTVFDFYRNPSYIDFRILTAKIRWGKNKKPKFQYWLSNNCKPINSQICHYLEQLCSRFVISSKSSSFATCFSYKAKRGRSYRRSIRLTAKWCKSMQKRIRSR